MSDFTYVHDGWKLIDEPRHDEKEAERLLARNQNPSTSQALGYQSQMMKCAD